MTKLHWIGFLAMAIVASARSPQAPAGGTAAPGGPSEVKAAPAAKPDSGAEITTREEKITFRERVNLVSVPVVVRDAKGRAVDKLAQEDFQLTDGGKAQTVSRFSVENYGEEKRKPAAAAAPGAATPPAEMPGRFVALVFDDLHTKFADLVWARQATEKFLSSQPPTERFALYTTSGQNGIDFTGDRDKLIQELRKVRSGVKDGVAAGECPQINYYLADLIIDHADEQLLNAEVKELYACQTMTAQISREDAENRVKNVARHALMEGDWNSRQALTTLRAVVGKLATAPGRREIVLVSDGFLLLDDHREMESELLEAAVRANVIMNGLNSRGLQAFVPGGGADQHGALDAQASIVKNSYQTSEISATEAVLAEAAMGTGGRLFQGSNDMEGGMERVAGMPECVYILAFNPQNLKFDGKYHSLKVTLRNGKGLTVDARRGYYAPNRKLDPKERARDEIQAAFFSTEELREIPTELETQFFKTGDEATVDVLAKLDLKQLNFRKEAERNRNDVTIVSGLFDENGNYVSGIQKVVEMRMKDQTLADRMAQGIAVRTSISGVKTGRYAVRMVVRDAEGQELTALSGGVEIP